MTIENSFRAALAAAASAATLLLGTGAASAATVDVTIDFGTAGIAVSSPYVEDGFEIAGQNLNLGAFGNPGQAIFFDAFTPTLTLTRTGGGAFSLKGFDYNCGVTGVACDFTVGGTQIVDVGNLGQWAKSGLAIDNITSLVFSRTTGGIRFDNIRLTYEVATTVPPGPGPGPGVSPVPLPAALPLLLAGLGGLGLMARRQRKAA